MCGIFGAIASGFFGRADYEKFKSATDLIHYRGPNDAGTTTLRLKAELPAEDTDRFDVFLGFRRLSILDLSPAGHQPMYDGKGHWIIFNGEIFNYVELREELKAKGHQFQSGTDTEVLLHVYNEYGEEGFDKLNGMWAFAIVDLPRRRVVLSRDRFSIKPLYLLETANALYFASEIKQLLSLTADWQIDPQVMSVFLAQGLFDHSSETFFRRIRKVAPKTNLVVSLKADGLQLEQKPYWDYVPAGPEVSLEEARRQFRELMIDSVKIRLRSDVKVGVLLSGGLDSSTIAVVADQLGSGELEMYSVVSAEAAYSEEKFIDGLTAAHRLQTRKLVFVPDHISETLEKVLYHNDEPVGGFSVLAQYKLFETIKRSTNVTVLLSGQGGDEILLGYRKFFFFYLRQLIAQGKYPAALGEAWASLRQRTIAAQFSLGEARRYLPQLNKLSAIITTKCELLPIWQAADMRERQILDIDNYSVPALAHYEDRNSMAHSLEVRHPFLDHRLVNFVVNLPTRLKIKDGWTKYLLRQSFPELPPSIRWRRDKQAYVTAEERWLRNDFGPLLRETFHHSTLGEMGIVNDKAFLNYYERFREGARIAHSDIARVLIAELWARNLSRRLPSCDPALSAA
jgi:asparagine synthase (glutamine-hydrolysing)